MASSHLSRDLDDAYLREGFKFEIFAPTPTRGVTPEIRARYKKIKYEEQFDGSIVIHRFSMFKEGKNPILRAIRYILVQLIQYRKGVAAKDIDLIWAPSTPPTQGLLCACVKRKLKVPFVFNLQDVFPDSLVGAGLAKKGGLLWRIGRRIEDFTYRNADKIIVISQDIKRNIMAKGVPESKIEVIYNWVDTDSVFPVEKDENPLYEEFSLSRSVFTVVYAGNLGNAQNLNILLDGAYMLPSVQFVVFGTGGTENEIRERISKDNLNNVRLLPLQPPERVPEVYSLGDVCVVSCKAGLGGSAMPSKTWSIMSCGRPVLASFDEGELKDILEENDCGVFTHAGNVQEFVEAIKRLSADRDACDRIGQNGRRFILENLTKEVGTRKYVEVIKQFEKK